MYSFKNDYSVGAHPNILKKLIDANFDEQPGYGEDDYSKEAKGILKRKIERPNATVYFLSGGTQTNLIVIASILRLHEAVISAKTGHIFANETGAIEATGHRVITVDAVDGKIRPADVQRVLEEYSLRPHAAKPRMVYISNSTEIGTIYTKNELACLYQFCCSYNLYLFMDGARLGQALAATGNDLQLPDIAKLTDVFYIGGTKNGALLGEAAIFNNPELSADFDYVLKQKGALLAKGRLLGIQFLELFRDDLYYDLAAHANLMAAKISNAFAARGNSFLVASNTNQIFPILADKDIEKLLLTYDFYIWKRIDADNSAIRLITSWATDENVVDQFIFDISRL